VKISKISAIKFSLPPPPPHPHDEHQQQQQQQQQQQRQSSRKLLVGNKSGFIYEIEIGELCVCVCVCGCS